MLLVRLEGAVKGAAWCPGLVCCGRCLSELRIYLIFQVIKRSNGSRALCIFFAIYKICIPNQMANKDLAEWLAVGPTFGIDLRDVITYFTVITVIISCFFAFAYCYLLMKYVEVKSEKLPRISVTLRFWPLTLSCKLRSKSWRDGRLGLAETKSNRKPESWLGDVRLLWCFWWFDDVLISKLVFSILSVRRAKSLWQRHTWRLNSWGPSGRAPQTKTCCKAWHHRSPLSLPWIRRESRNELAATQQQNSELKDVYFCFVSLQSLPLTSCFFLSWSTNLFVCLSLPLVFPAPEAAIHGGWHQAGRGKHQFFSFFTRLDKCWFVCARNFQDFTSCWCFASKLDLLES